MSLLFEIFCTYINLNFRVIYKIYLKYIDFSIHFLKLAVSMQWYILAMLISISEEVFMYLQWMQSQNKTESHPGMMSYTFHTSYCFLFLFWKNNIKFHHVLYKYNNHLILSENIFCFKNLLSKLCLTYISSVTIFWNYATMHTML